MVGRYIGLPVKGHIRLADADLWDSLEGPKPPDDWSSDGCSFSPDFFAKAPLWLACRIHDWHYSEEAPLGGNWAARRQADAILRRNQNRIFDTVNANFFKRFPVTYSYWSAVRLQGSDAFKGWKNGENPKDLSWWQRFREVTGLFKKKESLDATESL